jgi:hypothetical protein
MCGQTLKAAGRRLSESRMRENLMSGSMWQGMKTRHGVSTEALSEEMESNGSATPKSRRHPLTLPLDARDSARFTSIFLASSFFCSQALSTTTPSPVTKTVRQLIVSHLRSLLYDLKAKIRALVCLGNISLCVQVFHISGRVQVAGEGHFCV